MGEIVDPRYKISIRRSYISDLRSPPFDIQQISGLQPQLTVGRLIVALSQHSKMYMYVYRPFSVQKIRHTNLILLVVDTLCPCGSKQLSIEPIEALTEPGACIARRERLYRRRPPKCINYHPEEMEIKFCGSASRPCHFFSTLVIAIVSSTLATRFA